MSLSKKILILILVLVAIGGGFFAAGYRIDKNFKVAKVGIFIAAGLSSDTKIFVDGLRQGLTTASGENFEARLKPGEHSILVSRDGYWPWLKKVLVKSSETVIVYPFEVRQGASVSMIAKTDPNYSILLDKVKKAAAPVEPADKRVEDAAPPIGAKIQNVVPNARISDDEKTALWLSGHKVKAAWLSPDSPPAAFCESDACAEIIEAFSSPLQITNIEFMRDRNDVFIIGTSEGVYAIEFDKRGLQNFQPVYEDRGLRFVRIADSLYIINGSGDLLRLPI